MSDPRADIKARLLATFRVEAEEHLQAITANLVALDRGLAAPEARQVVEATFREVHTLKGAARSVSLGEVEALCQACEGVLSRLTRGELTVGPTVIGRLQEAIDRVARLLAGGVRAEGHAAVRADIERLEEAAAAATGPGAMEAPVSAPRPPAPLPSADTIRLAAARLDALLLRAEDLLIPSLAAQERVREARELVEAAARAGLRAVETHARTLLSHLVLDQRTVTRVVDGIQDELRQLRLTAVSTVMDLFPRMVRDLASEQGKDVLWAADGVDLEIDRYVLERMKEPLIHLIRNAIDHGIEPPEDRERAGKPRQGRLTVTVTSLEGGRVEIRVEDDGRGIDAGTLRAAAARARLMTAGEAEALPDEAALDLVFRSGLSTSPIITALLGHGLGLAIVKEQVERLRGEILLTTRLGAGTTVRMVLPASIATFHGLLVEAGGQPFLLPLEALERVVRVSPDELEGMEGRTAIRRDGGPLLVAPLAALLGLPERESRSESRRPCAILKAGAARAGVLVDRIMGDREVLVKPLRPPLVRVRNVEGAGLLGTGQVVLILRATELLRAAREAPRPAPPVAREERRRRPAILVVDDSITTRTMEKNLLEAAGFQVHVAVDGIEAWTALKSEEIDLVVSDVDMPRMDGFELTTRIRADRALADLPVVLVTALESREDKERGIEVGANAYVIKSSFDQSNLLEIIRRLV